MASSIRSRLKVHSPMPSRTGRAGGVPVSRRPARIAARAGAATSKKIRPALAGPASKATLAAALPSGSSRRRWWPMR